MKSGPESEACVLVITRTNDATADHMLRRMADRNIPYLRLNAEKFGTAEVALRFPNIRDSVISFGNARTVIGKIRGVWLRRLVKPQACQIREPEARAFAESEMDFTLRWLIDLLSNYCPILDGETRILKGRNKFDQLAIAETFGLQIPATLVTNDPAAAKDFVERHKAVAVKSVAGYGRQAEGGFYTVYTIGRSEQRSLRKEVNKMDPKENVTVPELTPLVFQLRELVQPGSERSAYLCFTQSSCGGEDTYECE